MAREKPPSTASSDRPVTKKPRLWPAWIVLILQAGVLVFSITPQINNLDRFLAMMAGPLACVVLFLVWLLLASRLRWLERLVIPLAAVVIGVATGLLVHSSMVVPLWIYGAPLAITMIVIGLACGRAWTPRARTGLAVALVALGSASFLLGRLDGFDGAYLPELRWRWQPSPEELLTASAGSAPTPDVTATAGAIEPTASDWPAFRGLARDSRVRGAAITTDWQSSPPQERWRIPIGPGWSSFAHVDGRLYTQEQRGEIEATTCYDAATGRELWRHETETRFTEVVSGAGPRATPTFADGRLYTLGAKATLSCLDASTGASIWQRNLMAELDAPLQMWGFSSSPLLTHDRVIVYAGGKDDHGLVAYHSRDGEPAWRVAGSGMNFASAQLVTIGGVELVLFTNESALLALDPATGAIVWSHTPEGWRGGAMVQPQAIGGDRLIVPLGDGVGVAHLDVARDGDGWTITERWSSRRLKPSFNDFVYYQGHLYGFDQSIFTCVDAETGARRWRRGRYGFGQVLLLEESASLLVTSETGEVVLLAADPAEHRELGRLEAISGKTWNHPIVVANRLFVRNGEEAACFELAMADAPPAD